MVDAVTLCRPSLAAVVASVRFELQVDSTEMILHVAQLRHALWTELAEVMFLMFACLLVEEEISPIMLGERFSGVVLGDAI